MKHRGTEGFFSPCSWSPSDHRPAGQTKAKLATKRYKHALSFQALPPSSLALLSPYLCSDVEKTLYYTWEALGAPNQGLPLPGHPKTPSCHSRALPTPFPARAQPRNRSAKLSPCRWWAGFAFGKGLTLGKGCSSCQRDSGPTYTLVCEGASERGQIPPRDQVTTGGDGAAESVRGNEALSQAYLQPVT